MAGAAGYVGRHRDGLRHPPGEITGLLRVITPVVIVVVVVVMMVIVVMVVVMVIKMVMVAMRS